MNAFETAAAAREARREYQRRWRASNPDKVRAANQRYWEKKGQEFLQSLAEGRAASENRRV